MTLADLIIEFRDEAADDVAPYMWPDATLIRYANDAQLEAAVRARFFVDGNVTAKAKAGTGLVVLDPKIIYVRGVIVGGDVLCPTYLRDMTCWPGWRTDVGPAERYIKDFASGKLRLHPAPATDITLTLTVVRGPAATLETVSDELEIPIRYQQKLVYWMLHRAFSKRDSGGDARDDKLAAYYASEFEKWFGPARAAIDEVFEQQQEDVYATQGGSF